MAYNNQYSNNAPRYGNGGGGAPRGSWGGARTYNSAPKKKSNSESTTGPLLVNERQGKFLRVRYWGQCMGVDIGTFAPGSQLDFTAIQNAQVFSHVFAFSGIFELLEICDEVVESLKTSGQFESTATDLIGTKKDAILEISNGENIGMPRGIYLVVYKSVDPSKRTNTFEIFPFASTKVYRNYDRNSGQAKEDIKATGDFKKFIRILKEAAKAFTMAQAHTVAEVQKGDKLATFTALSAITAAMGIDVTKSIQEATSRTSGQSSYSRDAQPQNYQRKSAPGQWNRGGQYNAPAAPATPSPWNAQQNQTPDYQKAMAAITDEPVDINLDAAQLQNVSLEDFK